MYDLDGDGAISPAELFKVLCTVMGRALSDTQLTDIVESTVMQYDRDGDGKLSFQEWMALVSSSDSAFAAAV